MILGFRTDKPEAELWLADNSGNIIEVFKWEAHRQLAETIHVQVKELLARHSCSLKGLSGITAFLGPGSFTGLRIGLSVANAFSDGLELPIAGAVSENWFELASKSLQSHPTSTPLTPEYGQPVHITQPKK